MKTETSEHERHMTEPELDAARAALEATLFDGDEHPSSEAKVLIEKGAIILQVNRSSGEWNMMTAGSRVLVADGNGPAELLNALGFRGENHHEKG